MNAPNGPTKRDVPPGSGRRASRSTPKGRQVDESSRRETLELLGELPRRRELLIEHLHLLQDAHGCLHARHLAALAAEMRLSLAEVFETASFYAHFDIVMDGERAPPPVTIRVCNSLSCAMAGSHDLLRDLEARLEPHVRVIPAPCMGGCARAPVVSINHVLREDATAKSVASDVARGDLAPRMPAHVGFDAYRAAGGYRLLEDLLAGRRTVEEVIAALKAAELKGMGGAGFPTGRKWELVRAESAPRLMAVNADEGEPGTFKDRHYLETDPHRFIEGMLIGAFVVEAADVYIYLRGEYPQIRAILERELAMVAAAGFLPHVAVHLRRGAGSYVCGEESAMLESIEGRRGLPRHKPPFPSQVGLFGHPTLINNVETLWWVRDIVDGAAGRFHSPGINGRKGLRSFSVSGRVRLPGVKLAPAGITARELIEKHSGGMLPGHAFKAYLPGGASGGILPAAMADIPLDFGTLEPHGCFIGSAALIVLSDHDDMRQVALNLLRFFEEESCGQCSPCRVGTEKAVALLERPVWDEALIEELATAMADASICGLGQAAMNPVKQILRHFRTEIAGGAEGAR
ncbi:MAG: NAD(P)H-dependent oxidoreductase subunit E [Hyphomicrobiales bacterium]|nr:NAD(P)H-dependent oxidoreductase subunit E [Hyphomicrobiales bacterium]